MYLSHFGFTERPFSITPDPRFLYLGERHREALSHLLYGMGEGGGFVQLTGEVGTGKTTLWRYALERLPPAVDVAVVLNSRLSALELLAALCDELDVRYPAGTASGKVLVDGLYRYLLDAHGRGRRTTLIIDEAQNLTPDALEQVRMLTNLETPREKLLQIILIGQPELAQLLARKELRQVAQRITARYHLLPLTGQETRAYVLYRTQVAGRRERIFDDRALDEVYRWSRGVPRLINAICDRALLGAYAMYTTAVDAATVRRAAEEIGAAFEDERPTPARRWIPVVAVGVAAAMTAMVIGFALRDGRLGRAIAWNPWRTTVAATGPDAGTVDGAAAAVSAPSAAPAVASVALGVDVDAPGVSSSAGAAALPGGTSLPPPDRASVADGGLDELLRDPALVSTRAVAFARLYALWGVTVDQERLSAPCEAARPGGLQCLSFRGTWRVLSRLDVPAVIDIVTGGTKHHAVVTAVGGEQVTLEFGSRRRVLSLDDVERFWDGAFTVLWKRPPVGAIGIEPGTRASGIVWLRRRLAAIEGTTPPERPSDLYDDALHRRVVAFQRARSLHPDGILGEETLLRLATEGDPQAPSLTRARPGA
jgi:general secretion pathway protein A